MGGRLGSGLWGVVGVGMGVLGGIGFVGVFGGGRKRGIGCRVMGIEVFGGEGGVYLGIGCVVG